MLYWQVHCAAERLEEHCRPPFVHCMVRKTDPSACRAVGRVAEAAGPWLAGSEARLLGMVGRDGSIWLLQGPVLRACRVC